MTSQPPQDHMQDQTGVRLKLRSETIVGPMISVALHMLFLLIAAVLIIKPPIFLGEPGTSTEIKFAIHTGDDTSTPADRGLNATDPLLTSLEKLISDPVIDTFTADVPVSDSAMTEPGKLQMLGGAGDDVNPSESLGGGGGTSFFGVAGRGRRFMYIVDVSGSMNSENRFVILRRNLKSSISGLPEHASFFVSAYNNKAIPMNARQTWKRASKSEKLSFNAWINNIDPDHGTNPLPSFEFALDKIKPRPDIIYFMTDGENIQGLSEAISELNNRGRKVKIHCIAFGNSGSEEMMRRIARDSGGKYRFVPVITGRGGG